VGFRGPTITDLAVWTERTSLPGPGVDTRVCGPLMDDVGDGSPFLVVVVSVRLGCPPGRAVVTVNPTGVGNLDVGGVGMVAMQARHPRT